MNQSRSADYSLPLIAVTSLVLLGTAGAAFYGWMRFGSSILLTLGESGLSWCF